MPKRKHNLAERQAWMRSRQAAGREGVESSGAEVRAMRATSALEVHLTVQQIATVWGLDPKTVTAWFRNEPGVLRVSSEGGSREALRIPLSVVERVHRSRSTLE